MPPSSEWKRLGLLIPSSNTTMEPEVSSILPPSITLHTSRMPITPDVTSDGLIKMVEASTNSAKLLADCRSDLILYGCTSGSFLLGGQFHGKVEERIQAATGIPCLSTSHCVLEALHSYGAEKLAIYTPYIDEVNQRARAFFEENGFTIAAFHGMGRSDNFEVGSFAPQVTYDFVMQHPPLETDAIFLSCTNLRTFEVIPRLRRELGLPVVSSNQASIWFALRHLEEEQDLETIFIPSQGEA